MISAALSDDGHGDGELQLFQGLLHASYRGIEARKHGCTRFLSPTIGIPKWEHLAFYI
jgi:hypothetical protein